MFRRILI